jgi:hypothetical protein
LHGSINTTEAGAWFPSFAMLWGGASAARAVALAFSLNRSAVRLPSRDYANP